MTYICPDCKKEYKRPSYFLKHMEKFKGQRYFLGESGKLLTAGKLTKYLFKN